VTTVAVDVLLAVGVLVQAGACLGVMVMRDAYQRLHYAAASTTVGPFAIAAALVVREHLAEAGLKGVVTAFVLVGGGAVLTHATGRAARVRELDGALVDGDELAS
jgi:multisubunit Na+/H+ antiporter MnhG subunit